MSVIRGNGAGGFAQGREAPGQAVGVDEEQRIALNTKPPQQTVSVSLRFADNGRRSRGYALRITAMRLVTAASCSRKGSAEGTGNSMQRDDPPRLQRVS